MEKRNHERLFPHGNAFAALGRQYTRVGRIKDISMRGVAFEYISVEDAGRDASQIDIFLLGDVFHLYSIPCEVVYDLPQPILFKKPESIKLSPPNRCGVQFGELTKDTMAQLKHFLEFHTRDLSP